MREMKGYINVSYPENHTISCYYMEPHDRREKHSLPQKTAKP